MKHAQPAPDPDAYVAGLSGWQRKCVESLRTDVRRVAGVDEAVKWGHLVYSSRGPVCLIRAESDRVLFGFWRGHRLRAAEPRLKSSGGYEMATIVLREGDLIPPEIARRLVEPAISLNEQLGDPRLAAPRGSSKKRRAE